MSLTPSPNYMRLYGERLIDNGYSIVPIMPGTKKPGVWGAGSGWSNMHGWQAFATNPATPGMLKTWSQWEGCGVGIVCGKVVAVDIDILDPQVNYDVASHIMNALGGNPLMRIGKKPKAIYAYRTLEPFEKITLQPIECLGLGQQFVAYAEHPDTQAPYSWPDEGPADVHIDSLPLVTADQVRRVMAEAYELIPNEMRRARLIGSDGSAGGSMSAFDLQGTPEAIASAMEFIANADLQWDDWNRIGMALFTATNGSGFDIFDQFSSQSEKYDAKETRARWDSYRRTPPTRIGAGTIYHHAGRNGWTPDHAISLNPTKREARELSSKLELIAPKPPKREMPPVDLREPEVKVVGSRVAESFPTEWLETDSLVGDVTRWITSTALYEHPTFALGNTLAFFGTLYGRRYAVEEFNTRANILIVALAKTGSGKDHSRKCVKSLFTHLGMQRCIGGDSFSSGIAVVSMLHDQSTSVISHVDEFGKYLQAMEGKNAASHQRDLLKRLLELYSSSSTWYHGQQYANMKDNPRSDIYCPNFNMFATTTPNTLVPALNRAMAEDGTLSRMLLVPPLEDYPEAKPRAGSSEPPTELISKLEAQIETFYAVSGNMAQREDNVPNSVPVIRTVKFGPGAREALDVLLKTERARKIADRTIWVRLVENTLKVAMIEAIARDPIAPVITPKIFAMAERLVVWSTSFTEGLMTDEVAESGVEKSLKRILGLIRAAGAEGLDQSSITRKAQDVERRMRDDIITTLLESGQITKTVTTPARGRPKVTFHFV